MIGKKEEKEEHLDPSSSMKNLVPLTVDRVNEKKEPASMEDKLDLLIFEKVQNHGDDNIGRFAYSLLKENDFKAAEMARKIRMVSLDLTARSETNTEKSRGKWQLDVYKLPWVEKRTPQRKLYDPDYQISFPLAPVNISSSISEILSPQNILKIESSHNHCLILTSKL